MTLYLDTSALVKLYVAEAGSAEVAAAVNRAAAVCSSRVAYPEARAALARRQRERGLTAAALRRAVAALDRDLSSYVIVELRAGVAQRAGVLAERHRLRGFDAIHLASALELKELLGSAPRFLTFDARQAEAAALVGLVGRSE